MSLVAVSLSTSFVAPVTQDVVAWMDRQASSAELAVPPGLDLRWTGDAVIGRDYMANVQTSLDRAAIATVVLLLIVLLAVYRSFWLALVPLATIGVSLLISRGMLAWMILAGWEVSSLVELFLIALLFGTGTDFCLFLSWRYAEHLNPSNPAGSMRVTLARSFSALVTSAGTIIIGLLLMGTTHFKLFSSTGPSVALGLVIALAATLTSDAGAAGAAGSGSSAGVRRAGRRLARILGAAGARGDGSSLAKLGFHHPGDATAVDSGHEYAFHSGPDDRAPRECTRRRRISGWSRRNSSPACWLRSPWFSNRPPTFGARKGWR